MRTRVKVCGVTRPVDAVAAARSGADALGLVFHPGSVRAVAIEQARAICEAVPPFVTITALFLDAPVHTVGAVLDAVPVDLLQFHGREEAAFCEQFGKRYIKALPMGGGADPEAVAAGHSRAAGFLLDSHGAGQPGGSGVAFDWARVPARLPRPVILAGGLHPGNVAAAVREVAPWAVDVSSGVESSPGIKDARRIQEFISEVQGVQHIRGNAAVD